MSLCAFVTFQAPLVSKPRASSIVTKPSSPFAFCKTNTHPSGRSKQPKSVRSINPV